MMMMMVSIIMYRSGCGDAAVDTPTTTSTTTATTISIIPHIVAAWNAQHMRSR